MEGGVPSRWVSPAYQKNDRQHCSNSTDGLDQRELVVVVVAVAAVAAVEPDLPGSDDQDTLP